MHRLQKAAHKKNDKEAVGKRSDRAKDEAVIHTVLDFYTKYGRHDLVWRKNITPYTILVSEIMLQQTQVKRVILKYKEWLKSYPTLKKLKGAALGQILTLWQGLGYQRRAKALLSIAQTQTRLPRTAEGLMELPGVGSYTASAVMAFAYNQFPKGVIETNIRTVLIEHFYPKKKKVTDELLINILIRLEGYDQVRALGARHWYYAMMDYGAHLKSKGVEHNKKSATYKKQSTYKGSQRELRAKVLFAITHGESLPQDDRIETVLRELEKEKFIHTINSQYRLV